MERSLFFRIGKVDFEAFVRIAPELERGILLRTKERLLFVCTRL